jgi:hypothetical protein
LIVSEDDDDVGKFGAARPQCRSKAQAGDQGRKKLKRDGPVSGALHVGYWWLEI